MPSLVVLVIHDMSRFSDILSAWQNAGAAGITIVEGMGSREAAEAVRPDDLPLFPTVRDVLHAEEIPRTTVFSVVPDETVDRLVQVTEEILGDLSEPGKGILFVVPVTRVVGLRPPPSPP